MDEKGLAPDHWRMPRSTTLNWYTQTNCGPGIGFSFYGRPVSLVRAAPGSLCSPFWGALFIEAGKRIATVESGVNQVVR